MNFFDEQLFGGITYTVGGYQKQLSWSVLGSISLNYFYSYDIALEEFQKYNNGALSCRLHLISLRMWNQAEIIRIKLLTYI